MHDIRCLTGSGAAAYPVNTYFFDVPALVHQVCDVLENPKAHLPLRRRARAKVAQRYDLRSRCLPRLVELVLAPTARMRAHSTPDRNTCLRN